MEVRKETNELLYKKKVISIKKYILSLLSNIEEYDEKEELVQELHMAFQEIDSHEEPYYIDYSPYIVDDSDILMFNYLSFDYLYGWYIEKIMIITKDNKHVYLNYKLANILPKYKKYSIVKGIIVAKEKNEPFATVDQIRVLTRLKVIK